MAVVVLCFVGTCFAVAPNPYAPDPACKAGKILLFFRFYFLLFVFFLFSLLLSTHLLICKSS